MAKILKMPLDITGRAAATTAPQDVLAEDAATFDVLRRMREDILCCVLKPDQRLRFGELRQRYGTSVGTLREALSHLVSEGLARTEAGLKLAIVARGRGDLMDKFLSGIPLNRLGEPHPGVAVQTKLRRTDISSQNLEVISGQSLKMVGELCVCIERGFDPETRLNRVGSTHDADQFAFPAGQSLEPRQCEEPAEKAR